MAYSDFTFKDLREKFGISNQVESLFGEVPTIVVSKDLQKALDLARILPVRSEKAKSELIIMPILLDLMKRNEQFFTIYSGDYLNADKERGLSGECDFILSKNVGTFDINTPLFTIVEAKKNDVEVGIPQCAAQMLGAKYYNKAEGKDIEKIYGCVTTADDWIFLKLEGDKLTIDNKKYYLGDIEEILGVFQVIIDFYRVRLG
jgi:hypothetical protein